jgi:hypothetical protein
MDFLRVFRIVVQLLAGKFAAVVFAILVVFVGFPLLYPGATLSLNQAIVIAWFVAGGVVCFLILCLFMALRTRRQLVERGEEPTPQNIYFCIFPD